MTKLSYIRPDIHGMVLNMFLTGTLVLHLNKKPLFFINELKY